VFLSGGAFTAAGAELLERVTNPHIEKLFEAGQVRDVVTRLLEARAE
jgi:hypothetical protein